LKKTHLLAECESSRAHQPSLAKRGKAAAPFTGANAPDRADASAWHYMPSRGRSEIVPNVSPMYVKSANVISALPVFLTWAGSAPCAAIDVLLPEPQSQATIASHIGLQCQSTLRHLS
jgi:hypothetical protein